MAFKPDSEALVLAALAREALHGYAIIRAVRDNSSGLFDMYEGQLYPLLHKMQARGLVVGEWQIQDSGAPRKTYTLTEAGAAELEHRRREWTKFTTAVSGVMLSAPQAVKEANHA